METVRRIIDADRLMSIISLPKSMQKQRLEVIIFPVNRGTKEKNPLEIDDSIRALTGAVPNEGMTLNDYRLERLARYEALD